MEQHEVQQENKPELSDTIRLDDIIREFGGGEKKSALTSDTVSFHPVREQETPARAVREDTVAFAPIREESAAVSAPEAQERVRVFSRKRKEVPPAALSGDTQPLPLIRETARRPSAAEPTGPIRIAAENKLPTPQKLLQKYRAGLAGQRVRLLALGGIAALCLLHLLYRGLRGGSLPLLDGIGPWLSVSLLLLATLLTPEAMIRGALDLVHLRISPHTLTSLAVILSLVQGASCAVEGEMGYCDVTTLLLFLQYCSLIQGRSAMYYTLRTVCGFENPMGIFDTPQLLENAASLRCDRGKIREYVENLTQPAYPQRVLSVYATVLLPLSVILALLMTARLQESVLTVWLVLLLCSMPCAAIFSYSYPFCYLAKRLSAFGGALCGWHSAEIFGSRHTIILRDEDLFGAQNVLSNGMKLFPGYEATRVTAYAYTAMELVGSPLARLLRTLLPAQPPRYAVTEHRVYDDGGVGLAIGPDIVLVGSLSFMRSMGVHMPEGSRVRQAVYVSVNGELAAIFAVKYKPDAATGAGLRNILANRNFSVVLATRDFLITPELLAARYELPAESLRFPDYAERLRLSESDPSRPSEQGALIGADTFGAFAMTVAAGRTLRLTGHTALALTLLAGCIGFLLCLLLLLWDALGSATPLHIAALQLLWTAVTGIVTAIGLRV